MKEQLDLLAELHRPAPLHTKHRATDPDTSRRAALESLPRAGAQRHRILLVIVESGERGLTYDDVSAQTGIVGVSTSARISELAAGGWIEKAGERKTSSGGNAVAWVASEKALAAVG